MQIYVFRGQVLTPTSLKTSEAVELICNGIKYILRVTKTSDTQYYIQCNDSHMEVDVYRFDSPVQSIIIFICSRFFVKPQLVSPHAINEHQCIHCTAAAVRFSFITDNK